MLDLGSTLQQSVAREGYAFVRSDAMRGYLATFGSLPDWQDFADSWNRLEMDGYMADGGRYRRRRHAVYAAAPEGGVERQPHQPHYQGLDYNPLNGGVARWFEPVEPAVGDGPTLRTILSFCRALFDGLASNDVERNDRGNGRDDSSTPDWHIEIHQFRIEARAGEIGRPTPEGLHRDGVDYVLVLLVDRLNIASGTTTVHALDGRALGSFTLTHGCDAALLDDRRVSHGVTPVEPLDPEKPAHRDVLVVTFAARPNS